MVFFPRGKISGQDVNTYLLKTNSEVVLRAEEQDAIWDELDKLSSSSESQEKAMQLKTRHHQMTLRTGLIQIIQWTFVHC